MQYTVERQKKDPTTPFSSERGGAFCFDRSFLSVTAIICLGFLLTSTAWLAWEHRLLEMVSPKTTDLLTMVCGYAFQAAGIGLFAVLIRRSRESAERLVPPVLILHALCLVLSLLVGSLWGTLASGFLMNLLCGYIAGWYLFLLHHFVPGRRQGAALGLGYSVSCLLSWVLSLPGNGQIYHPVFVHIVCAALTGVLLFLPLLLRRVSLPAANEEETGEKPAESAGVLRLILSTGAVVLLFSLVNNIGFAFPASDILEGVSVESSRLFYAVGLILAGFIADRSRKLGAVVALAGLITPFMLLALRMEPVSRTLLWALSYFAFGFYAVYRVLAFSDLAAKYHMVFLSGFGLMIGRVGDAVGEGLFLGLSSAPVVLIFLTALLFAATVLLFFTLCRPLYAEKAEPRLTEQERFYQFAARHDLSARERDILRLLLENKTNGEIAQELSISENTVKFHIHNLLQKTDCKNRNDLLAFYMNVKPDK